MTWTTVFDQSSALAGTNRNGLSNYTLRTRLPAALFTAAAGTQCRVTLRFGVTSATVSAGISEAWFGQCSGTAADFTGDQVQVKFGGLNTIDSSADAVVVSDAFTLAQTWDATKDYVFSWFTASGASTSLSVEHAAVTGTSVVYNTPNFAGSTTMTAAGIDTGFDDFITKIEINVSASFLVGDRVLDFGLNVLDTESTHIHVCSAGTIASYSDVTTLTLGNKNFGAGNAFGSPAAGSPSGRIVNSVAITDGTITTAGTVGQWAAVDATNSRLHAVGALTGGAAVTVGQTFSLTSFAIHLNK
jgi:hypothetical protein